MLQKAYLGEAGFSRKKMKLKLIAPGSHSFISGAEKPPSSGILETNAGNINQPRYAPIYNNR